MKIEKIKNLGSATLVQGDQETHLATEASILTLGDKINELIVRVNNYEDQLNGLNTWASTLEPVQVVKEPRQDLLSGETKESKDPRAVQASVDKKYYTKKIDQAVKEERERILLKFEDVDTLPCGGYTWHDIRHIVRGEENE